MQSSVRPLVHPAARLAISRWFAREALKLEEVVQLVQLVQQLVTRRSCLQCQLEARNDGVYTLYACGDLDDHLKKTVCINGQSVDVLIDTGVQSMCFRLG